MRFFRGSIRQKRQKARPRVSLALPIFLLLGILAVWPGAAGADIFYTSSNYGTGSAGVITRDGQAAAFRIQKDLVTNLGVDAAGFTFLDHNGAQRAMIREYQYGPNSPVYVYSPSDWKQPVVNRNDWGSNFHGAAPGGRYLYLTTYESYAGSGAEDTGEVVRVDMGGGYVRDKAYQYQRHVENGHTVSPHAEAIRVQNGKIYVLYGMPYNGVTEYEPSEIVEFDSDLNVLRKTQLKDVSGNSARNAVTMAYYGGKLYVAAMGGYQGPDSWGDVWQVDISSMTAKQVLDGHSLPYEIGGQTVNVGMYGIDFAADGTAFVLTGSYGADYRFRARLFVTTESRLAAGDAGTAVKEYTNRSGYSWDILWDEPDATLWCMTGTTLEARGKTGDLLNTFTPAELGDSVYTVSLLNGDAGGGDGGQGDDGGEDDENPSGGGGCDAGSIGLLGLALLALTKLTKLVYEIAKRRETR